MAIIVSIYSCQRDVSEPQQQPVEQIGVSQPVKQTVLGKRLKNPYSLENMQIAFDSIVKGEGLDGNKRTFEEDIVLEPTDLYVRFQPKDSTQYDGMMKDTTMVYYGYPLDYEIEETGEVYIDPEVGENEFTWQYTTVKPNHVFSDTLKYEILSELFIPEHHDGYEENPSDSLSFAQNTITGKLMDLETASLYLTGNLPKDELAEDVTANQKILGRRCIRIGWKRICWNVPDPWYPNGSINIYDGIIGLKPIEGVSIRARNWFKTRTAITNYKGEFKIWSSFTRAVNYTAYWDRYHFSVRNVYSHYSYRAIYAGPTDSKVGWNAYLSTSDRKNWYNASIFRAAMHYYYGNIKGLRRPPLNSFWKPQMKIGAQFRNHPNGSWGLHSGSDRYFGIRNRIEIYNPYQDSDDLYATVVHELAHASHWGLDNYNYSNTERQIKESWARGVQWELTRMVYTNYLGGATRSKPEYTQVVVDMIDDVASEPNEGSEVRTEDNVTGYSIRQIEDVLNGSRTWDQWNTNIKNRYNNGTNANLDILFNHWR